MPLRFSDTRAKTILELQEKELYDESKGPPPVTSSQHWIISKYVNYKTASTSNKGDTHNRVTCIRVF